MPLVAAAGAFLSTTGGAALASAGISAAGSIYAANQANSANKKAIAAQTAAADKQLALQQQQYDQTRADQGPYRQAGYAGLDALLGRFGLSGQSVGSAPASQTPQTGYTTSSGQFIDNAPGAESGATQPQSTSYGAYEAANPDLAAEAARVVGTDPRFPTKADYYAWHDSQYANENRASYTDPTQAATPAAGNGGQQLTADQQLQQQIGQEPTFAPRQDYQRPGYQSANVGLDQFQASPDYNFRLQEGSRNLNAFNAAKGALGSGAAMKALVDYGQNTAASEYNNWRNYVTGQTDKLNAFNQDSFNSDRAYGTDIYNTDRANTLNRYDTNRAYLTNRSDNTTNNLFRLAGAGQNATNFTNNAGQTYASNSGNIIQNNANAVSNAFSQTANTNAGLAGSLAGIGQSFVNAFQKPQNTMTSNQPVWI